MTWAVRGPWDERQARFGPAENNGAGAGANDLEGAAIEEIRKLL